VTAYENEQQAIEPPSLPSSLRQLSITPTPYVVPVPPTGNVAKIIALVKEAGARSVALLVPDRTKALSTLDGMTQVYDAAQHAGVQLTLYAADQAIVEAARQTGVAVLEVQGKIAPPRRRWQRCSMRVWGANVHARAEGVVPGDAASERVS
jgi:hypothetical protein